MLPEPVVRFVASYRAVVAALKKHWAWTAAGATGSAFLFLFEVFSDVSYWTAFRSGVDWAWPFMTMQAMIAVSLFMVWAFLAGALVIGYYEERTKALEVGRDCDVLIKRAAELRMRQEVAESERDALKAKVVELQQQQQAFPIQIENWRAEVHEAMRGQAHAEMEKLTLIAEKHEWNVELTIRFIDYEDRKLADEIEKFIHNFATWKVTKLNVSGDTIRPVFDSSRIELTGKNTHLTGVLALVLSRSRHFGGPVQNVRGHEDPEPENAVVTIFPRGKKTEA